MPSIMFHELIGYKFAKKNKQFDCNCFYLGLIVPDSVNAYGFAEKDARWKAHARDKDLDKWQENIVKFYRENEENFEQGYITGYLVHVLTDIICDKIYIEELYPALLAEGYNYNTAYSHYDEGIRKFENSNINEDWWKYVKEKIIDAEIIEINDMPKKMIEDEVSYVIKHYGERNFEEVSFITDKFADNVLNCLEKILVQHRII